MTDKQFKYNWPLIGNEHIIEYLEKSIDRDNVAGTYIFTGPDNLGKTTVANTFANILLCEKSGHKSMKLPCGSCAVCQRFDRAKKLKAQTDLDSEEAGSPHSDFYLVKKAKDKKNISIEQVRGFIRMLNMSSFLNSYKIGIIKKADHLSREAANAILKTLEEPKDKVVVILVTADIDALPTTIVSRSQVLYFRSVATETIYDYLIGYHKASRSAARQLSSLSIGRPALAVKFFEDEGFLATYRERAEVFVKFFSQSINGRLEAVNGMLAKKMSNQEAGLQVKRIIEIWQGLTRDLALIGYQHFNLIQHYYLEKELSGIKTKVSASKILELNKIFAEAKEFLAANVNPKTVLENISIQI